MTNDELAQWLNQKVGLIGPHAVTANVIRQWVQCGLITRSLVAGKLAPKGGPNWQRSGTSLRRAVRLAELRKAGHKRETALVVQAYLEWGYDDFDYFRKCLEREWRKLQGQLNRSHTTFLNGGSFSEASAVKKRAIKKQLGPIAPIFEGTPLQQTDEFYTLLFESARFGGVNSDQNAELIFGNLKNLMPFAASNIDFSAFRAIGKSISGMVGEVEEVNDSAIEIIFKADEREFRIARHCTRRILKLITSFNRCKNTKISSMPHGFLIDIYESLSPQLSNPPWSIANFVQTLMIITRNRDANCNNDFHVYGFESGN